ncbi:MAG: hypothetical protein ACE5KF_02720 [Kiloniellaceae bacterium]
MVSNKVWALVLIVVGVLANNVVYLQDLWLGQDTITLESWRAYLGIIVSLALVAVGLVLGARATRPGSDK